MPHYIDENNNVHFVDEGNEHLLPKNCTLMTDADATTAQEYTPDDLIELQRLTDVETEKESAGLKQITITQAHSKIDQIFDEATTIAQLKVATKVALKKIIPYII